MAIINGNGDTGLITINLKKEWEEQIMIMTNEEYTDFSGDLVAKFKAGEMTAEEVYAELNKVEGVVFSGPPRRNLPEKTIEEIEEIKREFNIK